MPEHYGLRGKLCSVIFLSLLSPFVLAKPMAPPDTPFGDGVIVFTPNMSSADINNTIGDIYRKQRYNEFGNQRYAFLFMPGDYGKDLAVDVRVGYYTQVLGMGRRPGDTTIKGAIRTQDESYGALTNFWRGAENISVIPTLGAIDNDGIPKDQNVWAVSQAAPLRRFFVKNGSLRLYQTGYASGGFLADSRVDGTIYSGTQQQWLTRNTRFNKWDGFNWNIVFSGCFGEIQQGDWPNPPYTWIAKTPRIKEKPYLYWDAKTSAFMVNIRTLRANVAGTDWHIEGQNLPLNKFFIAKPGVTAYEINQALASGKHLFFAPGVFHVAEPIRVTKANTIIFGLGFPTVVTDADTPAMIISDVDGVQLAGVMFDAGTGKPETLLLFGEKKSTVSHQRNPSSIYDAFCRVGGPGYSIQAASCFTINSNDIIGDDTWTWRADHVAGDGHLGWFVNKSDTGVFMNADRVFMYNLMVEHFQKYQTIWNGEMGRVIHYQSEIPYDVPNQAVWQHDGVDGYASYKIGDNVNVHNVVGLGMYTYFRDAPVWGESAIEAPSGKRNCIQHTILFWLNGNPGSGLRHVVNRDGQGVTINNRRVDYDQWPGGTCS